MTTDYPCLWTATRRSVGVSVACTVGVAFRLVGPDREHFISNEVVSYLVPGIVAMSGILTVVNRTAEKSESRRTHDQNGSRCVTMAGSWAAIIGGGFFVEKLCRPGFPRLFVSQLLRPASVLAVIVFVCVFALSVVAGLVWDRNRSRVIVASALMAILMTVTYWWAFIVMLI